MRVAVRAPERAIGAVVSEMTSQRRGVTQDVRVDGTAGRHGAELLAHVPLAEMMGYSAPAAPRCTHCAHSLTHSLHCTHRTRRTAHRCATAARPRGGSNH
jgi:translation elongation factor EF-G